MAAVLGNDIIMICNSDANIVACTKTHDITVTCDEIEISSPSQGQWREYIAGRKTWEITTSWLLVSQGFSAQMLKPGTSLSITIGSRTASGDRLTGTVLVTQAKVTATRGNLVQGSFRFKGTGSLT